MSPLLYLIIGAMILTVCFLIALFAIDDTTVGMVIVAAVGFILAFSVPILIVVTDETTSDEMQLTEPTDPIDELDEPLYRKLYLRLDLLDKTCATNNVDTLPVNWQLLANKLCF